MKLILAIGIAAIFCIGAFYKKWLDRTGAVAASVLGTIVWLAGGFKLALPILVFFISGSLFGKLKHLPMAADEKFNKPRDYLQVLCNGGVALLCLLFFLFNQSPVFIIAYFLSIAVSTSDTWSSELGVWFGGKAFDILNGRPVEKGRSGGISVLGTIAGFAAALIIALLGTWLFQFGGFAFAVILAGGFMGMLADSVIGSKWQAGYRLDDGRQTEFIGKREHGKLVKGVGWMTNDLVNLVSNLLITLLGAIFLWLFK